MEDIGDQDGTGSSQQLVVTPQNKEDKQIKFYQCVVCNLKIIEENKCENHHKKRHRDIPSEQNIFELIFYFVETPAFTCSECSNVFFSESDAKKHHLKRHQSHPIDQNICKLTTVKKKIKIHNQTVATDKVLKHDGDSTKIKNPDDNKQMQCEPAVCEPTHESVRYKVVDSHSSKCVDCGDHVDGCDLKQHSDEHSRLNSTVNSYLEPKKLILCFSCLKTMSVKYFEHHKNVLHNPNLPVKWVNGCGIEPLVQCPFCELQFGDVQLEKHVRRSHMEKMSAVKTCPSTEVNEEIIYLKPHECDFCGSKYFEDSIFKKCNSSNDTHVVRNVCDGCKMRLDHRIELAQYRDKRYHLKGNYEAKQKPTDDQRVERQIQKMYLCQVCGCDGIAEHHTDIHHSQNHTDIPKTKDIFQFVAMRLDGECSVCDEMVGETEFKEHVKKCHPSTPVMKKKNSKVIRYTFLRYPFGDPPGQSDDTIISKGAIDSTTPEQNRSFKSKTELDQHNYVECNGLLKWDKWNEKEKDKFGLAHQNGPNSSSANQTSSIVQNVNGFTVKLFNCRLCDDKKDIINFQLEKHMEKHSATPIGIDKNFIKVGVAAAQQCSLCKRILIEGWLNSHGKDQNCSRSVDRQPKSILANQPLQSSDIQTNCRVQSQTYGCNLVAIMFIVLLFIVLPLTSSFE